MEQQTLQRDTIVKILKPHPWHGTKGVITEGPNEQGSYGVIVKDTGHNTHYLSIRPQHFQVVE